MKHFFRSWHAPRKARRALASLFLTCLGLSATAYADPSLSATLNGTPTVLIPGGVRVATSDASGNVYVENSTSILKYNPDGSGGPPIYTLSGSDTFEGFDIAVDASGAVYALAYVGSSGTPEFIKLTPDGNSYAATSQLLGVTSSALPDSVVVDSAGNVYVSLYSSNIIQKWAPSGSTYTLATTISAPSPNQMAVDGAGNVFVAVDNSSQLQEYTLGAGGTYAPAALPTGPSFSGAFIGGISLDSAGDVFFTTTGSDGMGMPGQSGSPFTVREAIPGSSGYTTNVIYTDPSSTSFPTNQAWQITVQPDGSLLIATSVNGVEVLQGSSVNIGTAGVGGTAATKAITFFFSGTGNLSAAPQVLTSGTAGLDFTDAGTGTCNTNGTSQTYNTGDSCTVNVVFNPKHPGLRSGAVTLIGGGGAVVGTAYVYGTGQAALAGFSPATPSVAVSGSPLQYPSQLAMNANGDLYVANQGNSNVLMYPRAGATYGAAVTLGTAFTNPYGVAVDGAGNVFVADTNAGRIVEIPWNGTSFGTQVVLNNSVSAYSMVVDRSGNLYYVSAGNLMKVPANGGTYGTPVAIQTGIQTAFGLAIDGSGSLYVPDFTAGVVWKTTPGSSGYTSTQIASGLTHPEAVAVDAAGDVYIGFYRNPQVMELALTQSGYGALTPVAITSTVGVNTAFADPCGLTVDNAGNLFVVDCSANPVTVTELAVSAGPGMTFATATPVGSIDSADGAQTAKVSNLGNSPLHFTAAPQYQGDFAANTEDTNLCATSSVLQQGDTCDVSVNFQPTASGSRTGSVTLTNDSQGGPTQTIALAGTGAISLSSFQVTFQPGSTVTAGTTISGAITALNSSGQPMTSLNTTAYYTVLINGSPLGNFINVPFSITNGQSTPIQQTVTTAGTYTITVCSTSMAAGACNDVSSTATFTVNPAAGSRFFTLSNQAAQAKVGSELEGIQAVVADTYGNGVPNVNVTFTAPSSGASTTAGTAQVQTDSNGIAYYNAFANGIGGTYQVTAQADGIATQIPFTFTNMADTATVGLTATPGSGAVYGQSVTLAATVTPGAVALPTVVRAGKPRAMMPAPVNLGPPTGTVDFYDTSVTPTRLVGSASLGGDTVTVPNARSGARGMTIGTTTTSATATLVISAPAGGDHSYTASYRGDASFGAAQTAAPLAYSVGKAAATLVAPSSQPIAVTAGQGATVAVSVNGQYAGNGIALPTGTVTYQIGSGDAQQADISNGSATLTVPATLATGSYSISVTYSGDGNYQAVNTAVVIPIAVTAVPDYTLTATPSSLTLKAGQTGQSTFTLTPTGGYVGSVTFACNGLPQGVSCSFSPQTLSADGSNKVLSSVLTVTTQGPNQNTTAMMRDGGSPSEPMRASLFLLPSLLFGALLAWQRKKLSSSLQCVLALAVITFASVGLTGCGGHTASTPVGTSTVMVTATASASATGSGSAPSSGPGAATHTATFTLTIVQ